MSDVRRDSAPIGDAELDAIERRADGADVARLVAEIRRLAHVADARGDEILRLSRLLDDAHAELDGVAGRTSA